MNSKFIPEHDEALKSQNLGPWLMKSSQSNFDFRSPSSFLVLSYLITTVKKEFGLFTTHSFTNSRKTTEEKMERKMAWASQIQWEQSQFRKKSSRQHERLL